MIGSESVEFTYFVDGIPYSSSIDHDGSDGWSDMTSKSIFGGLCNIEIQASARLPADLVFNNSLLPYIVDWTPPWSISLQLVTKVRITSGSRSPQPMISPGWQASPPCTILIRMGRTAGSGSRSAMTLAIPAGSSWDLTTRSSLSRQAPGWPPRVRGTRAGNLELESGGGFPRLLFQHGCSRSRSLLQNAAGQ